jgi:chloride channel protein, CIC family
VNVSPVQALRWLPEFWHLMPKRLQPHVRLLLLSTLVGVVAGLGAVVFYGACQVVTHYTLAKIGGYEQLGPGGEVALFPKCEGAFIPWLLLIIPTLGGLISGVIVYTLAPEAEGHGTDAAIDAYHHRGGIIRPRVPLIKILASAITLGTGGSGGREGPIAQIGAGFGSFLANMLRLDPKQRRTLMAAGMGAGIAAIFRAPLAGALFAAEVLYRSPDFESEVVIPAGLSSVVAYTTFGLFFGWNSLFSLPAEVTARLTFDNPWQLIGYTVLVAFMVLLAAVYTRGFYGLVGLFHRLRLPRHFRPMIGALVTGAFALVLYLILSYSLKDPVPAHQSLAVLSFGYGILQQALTMPSGLESSLSLALVLALVAFGKILTTGLTIGSGGSGGVFGPSMVIGGCGGGALGIVLHVLWPAVVPHPAAFVIVGMAGFFSAAAKTPFSTIIIVSEMTGGYALLLPALWVCTLSFLVSDEHSIYRNQLESPAHSPAHTGDYVRAVLRDITVQQFLSSGKEFPALQRDTPMLAVIERLADSSYQALPVLNASGQLLGMVDLDDVHLASQSPNLDPLVVAADLMRAQVKPLRPDDRLDHVVELFVENDLDVLPVVNDHREVVGLVRRSEVSRTYLRHVHGVAPVGGPNPLPPQQGPS